VVVVVVVVAVAVVAVVAVAVVVVLPTRGTTGLLVTAPRRQLRGLLL